MSITRNNPNTIFLGGRRVEVNDLAAAAVITPGALVVRSNNAGVIRWTNASADIAGPPAVATDAKMLNKGVDDTYAINDLVEVSIGEPGSSWWMILASGQNIVAGDILGSHGTGGALKKAATVAIFNALENKSNLTGALTRIRVEVI